MPQRNIFQQPGASSSLAFLVPSTRFPQRNNQDTSGIVRTVATNITQNFESYDLEFSLGHRKNGDSKSTSNTRMILSSGREDENNQNKLIWMRSASGIKTTDTKPKLAMSECKIGNTSIKVYGIAKGSGMIFPNMATTLGFVFTDANLSSSILKNILKDTIETTFNAISGDGDTSTNDMVSIFATNKANNSEIKSHKDKKLHDFKESVHEVLLNLAKRVAADGEGASKFVTISCQKARTISDAKKICISISNSPLVKTAISGEDPNWGRIAMAIGKTEIKIDIEKLTIFFGPHKIFSKNEISKDYDEQKVIDYMKNESLEITVDIGMGKKNFTSYTMDLTKDYIEINADYRS